MKRYILFFAFATFMSGSSAFGQGLLEQFGRQLEQRIQQEFVPQQISPRWQQDGRQDRPRSFGALPNESGRESNGGDQFRDSGGGFGFQDQGVPQTLLHYPEGYRESGHQGQPYYQGQQGQPFYQGQPTQGNFSQAQTAFSRGDLPSNPVMTSQFITIRCPAETRGNLSYLLSSNRGNFRFSMAAGQEQRFRAGTDWIIGFNDGVQEKRYRLNAGKTYTLKREPNNQWKLYVSKPAGS